MNQRAQIQAATHAGLRALIRASLHVYMVLIVHTHAITHVGKRVVRALIRAKRALAVDLN